MTAAEVRVPYARPIVIATAALACAAILWLSRNYTFYFDEWTFIITAPGWTTLSYFQPHNEHPAILLRLLYSILLGSFGLGTYLPYMFLLLLSHFANVLLLFELVRRRAGDLIALASATLLLVLGAAWEDILWAFQVGWLASVASGLAALLLLQGARSRTRLAAAAGLLTASLMFSGIGLTFAVAAGIELAATPGRRRDLWSLAPVAIALGLWYLAFGRFGNHPDPQPTLANVFLDPPYTLWGLGSSAAGLIGEGGWLGPPLLAAAVVVLLWTWRRRRPDPLALGVAAGLVVFYAVAGLTRAQLGLQQSGASRYTYIGAVLWLILLADAAKALPWRGTWRPALVACVFLACFNSGVLLFSYAAARAVQMERERADLNALIAERSDPCLNPHAAVDPLVMPYIDIQLFYRAVDLYGAPVSGPIRDHPAFAAAVHNLLQPNCSRP